MNSHSSSESAIYSPPFCQQVGGADECRPATGTAHNARLPLFCRTLDRRRAQHRSLGSARPRARPGRTAWHIGADQILEQLIQPQEGKGKYR